MCETPKNNNCLLVKKSLKVPPNLLKQITDKKLDLITNLVFCKLCINFMLIIICTIFSSSLSELYIVI